MGSSNINVLENNSEEDAFWIFRKNYFMGKHMKHGGLNTDKVIRLFKRDTCNYENKYVHEEIVTRGEVGVLMNKLIHNTYISLDKYIEKKNRYASWSAMDYIEKNDKVRFIQIILKSSWRFHKHCFLQRGILDGIPGLA